MLICSSTVRRVILALALAFACLLDTTRAHSTTTTTTTRTLVNQCGAEDADASTLRCFTLQCHVSSTPAQIIDIVQPPSAAAPRVSFHLPWPWSYTPLCTTALPGVRAQLCVYTCTTFASGRGISIVTTPEVAAHIASLPAFTGGDSSKSATGGRGVNEFSGLWFTSSIPQKGVGTLALHDVAPHTQILRYTPAFAAYLESDLSTLEREALWRTAIGRLPPATRDAFLGLSTIYGDARVRVQDITKANTFQLSLLGANHLAIFPETSRLNHDCAPNAQYVLDPRLLTHTVQATRFIPEGGEISIAYTSPLERKAVRGERLVDGFHFQCKCRRCVDGERSDEVLVRIEELQAQLNDWSAASRASPEMAEELVGLYVGEGLEGFLDVPYGFAALACNAVGSVEEAGRWARKAKRAVLLKDGRSADALRIWDSLLANAEAHWSYRRRLGDPL